MEYLLQVEGDVEEEREEGGGDRERRNLCTREGAVTEEAEREHRFAAAPLDEHEREQEHSAAGERGEDAAASPAVLVSTQECQHEQEQAGRERCLSGPIEPARRRAISLPPRAAGPLSLPRSDQFERSGPAPRSTGSTRADRASGSWGRWRSAARGEPGACQIHSLNRGRGSVPPGRQMKVHRCP